jgi:hypothetical protein
MATEAPGPFWRLELPAPRPDSATDTVPNPDGAPADHPEVVDQLFAAPDAEAEPIGEPEAWLAAVLMAGLWGAHRMEKDEERRRWPQP